MELQDRKRIFRIVNYAAAKVGAACAAFLLFVFVVGGDSLFDKSEMARERPLLLLFFVYGVAVSVVVDALAYAARKKIPAGGVKFVLYLAGGFVPFLFFGEMDFYTWFAGIVGVVWSMIFWGAYTLIKAHPKAAIPASLCMVLIATILVRQDFSVKRGWTESVSASSYEATFSLMHGEHEVAIDAEAGSNVQFIVKWQASGGHGMHVLDDRGKHVPMQTVTNAQETYQSWGYAFTAERSGTYRIVLNGNQASGKVKVDWRVE